MGVSHSFSAATKPLPPRPTGIALGIIGIILLGIAVILGVLTHKLERSGIHAYGVVVELERSGGSHYPVFKFRDIRGHELTIRSSISSKRYFVGDRVPILYYSDSPLDAEIDDRLMLYFLPTLIGFLGVMFLLGMFMLFKLLPYFERAYDAERARQDEAVARKTSER